MGGPGQVAYKAGPQLDPQEAPGVSTRSQAEGPQRREAVAFLTSPRSLVRRMVAVRPPTR